MGIVSFMSWKIYDSTVLLGESQPSQNSLARTTLESVMGISEVYFVLESVGSEPFVV